MKQLPLEWLFEIVWRELGQVLGDGLYAGNNVRRIIIFDLTCEQSASLLWPYPLELPPGLSDDAVPMGDIQSLAANRLSTLSPGF